MKKNTKFLLIVGTAMLVFFAIMVAIVIAVRPFFNLANVVSGGH